MSKIDVKKTNPKLYGAPRSRFVDIEVPPMRFVKVDGRGDPNREPSYREAVSWLYAVSYAQKFAAKAALGVDYVVPPLEGLWWADDPADFVARRKSGWQWTMLIMAPDIVDPQMFTAAVEKACRQLGEPPPTLRLELLHEGHCLQALHIGSYDDEGHLLARLHDELMPARGLTFAGPHHEIYLSDPRKTAPAKLRTILRQPVKPVA